MASILDRYGIKEVADVTFYKLDDDGNPAAPVLYLDTLKVSTIEQTAETSYAQGGKGNPRLIGWDFGKEITLTLEDALFSPKSMAIMFGDGTVATAATLKKTVRVIETKNPDGTSKYEAPGLTKGTGDPATYTYTFNNNTMTVTGVKYYTETGEEATEGDKTAKYCTFNFIPGNASVINVGPNTFPDTYYITGDTFARSENNGDDDFFQFIVPKGKITSENTITMEADGDPSVFSMTVDVLRGAIDGKPTMMQLVKYDLGE